MFSFWCYRESYVRSTGKSISRREKRKNSEIALWLLPIHVRIIPVSEKYIDFAKELGKKFEKEKIRIDIDDRAMTVEKRVREAELEWVPYILVVGEKEKKLNFLNVRIREEKGKEVKMKFKDLVKRIREKISDKPFMKLSLPKLLSKRPKFVG